MEERIGMEGLRFRGLWRFGGRVKELTQCFGAQGINKAENGKLEGQFEAGVLAEASMAAMGRNLWRQGDEGLRQSV